MISVSKRTEIAGNAHKFFTTRTVASFPQIATIIQNCVWSPIVWSKNVRSRSNFLSCSYVSLDFDNGVWDLARAEKWLTDFSLAGIIGTSKSHQKEKISASGVRTPPCDRFRVVVPFAETITNRALYESNMRLLAEHLPVDSSCTDAARFFYPCNGIYAITSGRPYPIDTTITLADPAEQAVAQEADLDGYGGGLLPGWILQALVVGVGEGGRHTMVYRIAANLCVMGYKEHEIIQLILKSPLADIGEEDVRRAVRNGINRVQKERYEGEQSE